MPLPLAPLIAFAIGVMLAWLSRAETNHDESFWSPRTLAVSLYAMLVFAPVTGYFATFATDWSCAYFFDGRSLPSAVSLVLVLFAASCVVGGFFAGRRALERHAPGELAWLAGFPLAIVLVYAAALYDRLGVDATYDQFVSNFGREPIFTSRLGFAVVWMDGLVVAGAVFTARWLTPNRLAGQTPPPVVRSAPVVITTVDDGPKRFLGSIRTPR